MEKVTMHQRLVWIATKRAFKKMFPDWEIVRQSLSDRQREIIEARYGRDRDREYQPSFYELAGDFGISKQGVRDLIVRGLENADIEQTKITLRKSSQKDKPKNLASVG